MSFQACPDLSRPRSMSSVRSSIRSIATVTHWRRTSISIYKSSTCRMHRAACQNPRDKVYGLLALVGDISNLNLWLTLDYSKSENEVFYDATIAMLYREWRCLKCLTGVQCGLRENKWASWVRDFGTPITRLDADTRSNRLMTYELFDASKGSKTNFNCTEHGHSTQISCLIR